MDTIDYGRALVPMPGQERLVKRRFWEKVRRTLGRVPFLDHAVAAYYAATDPATPRAAKGVLMAALAYFVVPVDFVPDILAGIGFSDDATVVLMAVQALAPHIGKRHYESARRFFEAEAEAGAPPAA
jgi:uncharacterized membrane protein YkvA (DUF1232 family)